METSPLQEEDIHLVEHGGWVSVGGESHLLPLRSPGVWGAGLVEAGPEPPPDPQTRAGPIGHQGSRWARGSGARAGRGPARAEALVLSCAASRPVLEPIITVEGLRKRGARNPVENAMQLKEKRCRTQEAKDIRRAQKEAGGYTDRSSSSTPVKLGGGRGAAAGRRPDVALEKGEVIDFSSLSSSDRTPLTSPSPSPSPDFSAPGTPASHSATPSLLSEADLIPDAMPPQALFHGETECVRSE